MLETVCVLCGKSYLLPDSWSNDFPPCPHDRGKCEIYLLDEGGWLAGRSPFSMMAFLLTKVSNRKIRLAACAFSRRLWHLLTDQRSRDAIEIAEKYADNLVGESELATARLGAIAATTEASPNCAVSIPADAVRDVTAPDEPVLTAMLQSGERVRYASYAGKDDAGDMGFGEVNQQRLILHDIFGNPFRPIPLNSSAFLTSNVKEVATLIYAKRAFDRLPILADALEDAGCSSNDILSHLRQPGEHVRGCWALDRVLGRE